VKKLQLSGSVYPASMNWWSDPVAISLSESLPRTLTVTIRDSRFVASLFLEDESHLNESSVLDLKNELLRLVQRRCGVLALQEMSWVVCVPELIAIDDSWSSLSSSITRSDASLPPRIGVSELSVLSLVVPEVGRAVDDLAAAVGSPHDTAFLCYRALESLRVFVCRQEHLDRRDGWIRLRQVVGLDRDETMDVLEKLATAARHGDHQELTSAQRETFYLLVRSAVQLFAAHLLRDSAELSDFVRRSTSEVGT
jgi:hypothetical protein